MCRKIHSLFFHRFNERDACQPIHKSIYGTKTIAWTCRKKPLQSQLWYEHTIVPGPSTKKSVLWLYGAIELQFYGFTPRPMAQQDLNRDSNTAFNAYRENISPAAHNPNAATSSTPSGENKTPKKNSNNWKKTCQRAEKQW